MLQPEHVGAKHRRGGQIFRLAVAHRLGGVRSQAIALDQLCGERAERLPCRRRPAEDRHQQDLLAGADLQGDRAAAGEDRVIIVRLQVDVAVLLSDLIDASQLHGRLSSVSSDGYRPAKSSRRLSSP